MMPDNTLSTLEQIQIKVRRLTRSPSPAQLSDDDINDYINTFVLYDFPEHLRLFSLRTTLTFYCAPYTDTYATNTTDPTDPLYNFINEYTTIHPPVYIAGNLSSLSQDRTNFFAQFPMINDISSIGTRGDGTTVSFSGKLSAIPVLKNNVTFTSMNTNYEPLTLIDDGQESLIVPNDTTSFFGSINYVTGQYSFNFPSAPADGATINSQTVPYNPAIPTSMLYYDNVFTLRPVPDQPYRIDMEAYIRPTELLEEGDEPKLSQWWQYIAYGAAKKIFEDRMDIDSVQLIMPEFKKQETLVLRSTIVQYTNDRVSTIYTEQTDLRNGNGNGNGGTF
jgi:hypothetical protein